MNLSTLCDAAGIAYPDKVGEREIAGIAMDTRRVCAGGLFICIKGGHTDGHALIPVALRRGAACIVAEQGCTLPALPEDTLVLYSENTRRCASYLFDAWYGFPSRRMSLIAVTGTNGKTGVTHLIRTILEAGFHRCGLIGTVGCESAGKHLDAHGSEALANMTTPDPPELYRLLAEMADDGMEYVLMEATSHALALEKLAPLHFAAAVFTNLTPEHLDFHGSMEAYASAKASLFEKSDVAVINIDSPYFDRMIARAAGTVLTCSLSRAADYRAENIEYKGTSGVQYTLCAKGTQLRIGCPIPGRFTVPNSMQAAVCALQLGIPARTVKDALASACGVKGRMERVRLGFGAEFCVLIDYAHTPDALENLLRSAKELKKSGGRIVLLFGCGGDRDRGKRALMGKVASSGADFVIVTSDNSRGEDPYDIIRDILRGLDPNCAHKVIADRKRAIEYAIDHALAQDVILLAGKGHEEYEIVGNERHEFCEREIVRRTYNKRKKQERDTERARD